MEPLAGHMGIESHCATSLCPPEEETGEAAGRSLLLTTVARSLAARTGRCLAAAPLAPADSHLGAGLSDVSPEAGHVILSTLGPCIHSFGKSPGALTICWGQE